MSGAPRPAQLAMLLLVVAVAVPSGLAWAQETPPPGAVEVVEVRVRGNPSIADDEILALAGIEVGSLLLPGQLQAAEERLRHSGHFDRVQIMQRYRSLTRRDRVSLIITVHERVSAGRKFLFLPEVQYNADEDFSIGARASANDLLGLGEFLSVPVLWGGLDRAALEIRRDWDSGWSVGGEIGVRRFENPHFRVDDERLRGGAFAQYRIAAPLVLGVHGRWDNVSFGDIDENLAVYGASVRLDTRPDPGFAYDSVLVSATWEAVNPETVASINRFRLEVAGYKTLVGQAVLAVRGYASLTDAPLPEYEKSYVGGMVSLRGYRAGRFIGDNAVLGTVELRVPVSAVRSIGRVGFTAFWDVGTAYDGGTPLSQATFHHGVGGGVFLVAPIVRLNVDVGTDLEGSTRVHFGFGFRF